VKKKTGFAAKSANAPMCGKRLKSEKLTFQSIFNRGVLTMTTRNILMTVAEVAALLQAKEKTIRQWVYKRKIPSLKLNGLLRFSRDDIEQWITGLRNERQPCW
jgi:excisionase family DNA binding protein